MPLPKQFIEQITALTALEPRVGGLIEALESTPASVSVRLNMRGSHKPVTDIAGRPLGNPVPWCDNGYYLAERPRFTLDPAIHQGRYYVQDASSMFLSHVIDTLTRDERDTPLVYLDACAAPGGKTTAAIDRLPAGSLVVANEWDFKRASILRENLSKWGHPDTVVSRGDTRRIAKLRAMFDIIAADVPCSGEGMMRKDPEAVSQWSPALVAQCAERQREIIDNLWPALKPGGLFIYSTCTFNRAENEEMVAYIADTYGAEPVDIDTAAFPGILPGIGTPYPCYRFMPHRVEGEGLFMAVLRKPGTASPTKANDNQRRRPEKTAAAKLPDWLPASLHLTTTPDGELYGISPAWKQHLAKLLDALDVIMPGTHLATVKGRDYIPAQALALSPLYRRGSLPEVEVDTDTALAYLHRDTIVLPDGTPRGFVLLTHGGYPLGWVKNIGNRSNNLYPPQWRILQNIR
ncbi:MAG: hypothetical protein K2N28_07390 [Muribaculaceae bacterium]|nr:hypothetical protein [Muribaculaceae bacterium]